MIGYFSASGNEPIPGRLEYIKGRLIGKLLLGEVTGPEGLGPVELPCGGGRGEERERKEA